MSSIPPANLHHQFVLDRDPSFVVSGWDQSLWGGFSLSTHPSLPVRAVVDASGQTVGVALGWLLGPDTSLDEGVVRLPLNVAASSSRQLEDAIYRFGGRFVFFVVLENSSRIYLDPCGSLALVYSSTGHRVASTVSALVIDSPEHSIWSTPLKAFPANAANQYWPAGLTSDPSISRLLPNHFLDLGTWRATRHYPMAGLERVSADAIPDAVQVIAGCLTAQLNCLAGRQTPVYLPLTGGQDSRTILACSRRWCNEFEYVTFDYTSARIERGDQVDRGVGRYFAERFGLRHHVLPVRKDLPADLAREYLQRIGYAGGAGKAKDFYDCCRTFLDLRGAWLTGFAGEVGRAFFWRPEHGDHEMTTEGLLERMLGTQRDDILAALDVWRRTLPDSSLATLLDFAYLEHRVGCWASPHLYGAAGFSVNLTPFNHRTIIDAMLRLPTNYTRQQGLAADIIAVTWPELLDIPFSQR